MHRVQGLSPGDGDLADGLPSLPMSSSERTEEGLGFSIDGLCLDSGPLGEDGLGDTNGGLEIDDQREHGLLHEGEFEDEFFVGSLTGCGPRLVNSEVDEPECCVGFSDGVRGAGTLSSLGHG
ncbi:hypothetical protein Dimus_017194 [Dionaea muscipula]